MARSLSGNLALRAAAAAALAVVAAERLPELVALPPWGASAAGAALGFVVGWVLTRGAAKALRVLIDATEDSSPAVHSSLESLAASRHDDLGRLADRVAALASGESALLERQRQADERSDALAAALPDAVFWLDRHGRVTDYREGETGAPFLRELPRREHPLAELLPEPVAPVFEEALQRVFEQAEAQRFEFDHRDETADPVETRPYRARFIRCGDDHAIVLVRELPGRRAASQKELETILDASIDPILIVTPSQIIRDANAAARQQLGIDGGDQPALDDVVPEWARPLLSTTAIPTALQEGAWRGESALLDTKGEEIPVSLTLVAHRTADDPAESVTFIARDLTRRQRLDDQLTYVTEHDPLTALFTRRRFVEELEKRLEPEDGGRASGAVVVLDLDDLKYVNESLGHGTGDRLLVGLAQTLRRHVGAEEMVARLDGDEFAVLMSESPRSHVESAVERLLEAVRSHVVVTGAESVGVSASSGLVLYPEHGTNAEELLSRAERALGVAKERGRNQFAVYTSSDSRDADIASRLTQERSIREALEHDRFVLFAQPIVDLVSGRVAQYEILLRMLAEDGSLLAPCEFLGTAEKFGLIRSVDRWVVRESIRAIGRQRELGRELSLSVNLSGKSVGDFELTALIESELEANGVAPQSMAFEITETTAVSDAERAKIFAIALKQIGCRIALDDFGVGWSSFHKLKAMPLDYLKIDGSFIRNLPTNKVDQHLVHAIVEVAHALRKRTVAEFVGSAQTLDLLREAGVDLVQGNYIGKAEPLESLLQAYPGAESREPTLSS